MHVRDRQVIVGLLWLQALMLGSAFGTWTATCLASLLATLMTVVHQRGGHHWLSRLARGGRPAYYLQWVLLPVGVLLWRTGAQTDAAINLLSLGVDGISHLAFFSAILLWIRHPQRGHVGLLPLGMIVLLLAVAGGAVSRSLAAQITVGCAACLGFAMASQAILICRRPGAEPTMDRPDHADSEYRWWRRIIALGTLSILLMTTTVIANVTRMSLPGVQQAVQRQLQETLDAVGSQQRRIGGMRYVKSGQIGAVLEHMIDNPTDTALTVRCRVAPGYLRGRAFDLYRDGVWSSVTEKIIRNVPQGRAPGLRTIQPEARGRSYLAYNVARPLWRFPLSPDGRLRQDRGPRVEVLVRNDPAKGYVVFLPLGARWIEAQSQELTINDHGIVVLGVDVTEPYIAGIPLRSERLELTDRQRSRLTSLPASMATEFRGLVDEICRPEWDARETAERISVHFQIEGSYSLKPTAAPAGLDPLLWFLRSQHPAHCEYFAAATTLALRAADIPSRYVIGYVADQPHETEPDLWVARNQDAHAWAEAFDESSGEWFVVESTPGRTYQDLMTLRDAGNVSADLDAEEASGTTGAGHLLSRVWGRFVSLRTTDVLLIVFQSAQLPLFLFLVVFWWLKFHRHAPGVADPLEARSRRMLRKVERRLKHHALRRDPSETLHQFAGRIETTALQQQGDCHQLQQIAAWYRQYAVARYQGKLPQPLSEFAALNGSA